MAYVQRSLPVYTQCDEREEWHMYSARYRLPTYLPIYLPAYLPACLPANGGNGANRLPTI